VRAIFLSLLGAALSCACADAPASPSEAVGGTSAGGAAAAAAGGPSSSITVGGVAGQAAGSGGANASLTAGTGGDGNEGGASAGKPSGGSGSGGSGGETPSVLTIAPAEGLWTGVRYYTGSTPSGRSSGPKTPPEKTFKLHNTGTLPLTLTLNFTGADASRFKLTNPTTPQLEIAGGADAELHISMVTDNALLSAAPAQNDGATVFNATFEIAGGGQKLSVRNYALVLTYAELEPTFGQIFRAFPEWTTKLPSWLPDNANPNPGTLPGVVEGTDEVSAPRFERVDSGKPVTFQPLARFSPAGLVPFGWYEPTKIAQRTTVGTLATQTDPQTNDKARMLGPPLTGNTSFEASVAKFGIWMAPSGVGLLTSNDADGFDGLHRVRAFTLRDSQGTVIPGSFLIAGEEAKNGDYQDYVFVLTNVKPAP